MGYTSQLKPQVDLPVWEWMRFAPTVNSAISSFTAPGPGSPTIVVSASLSGGLSGSSASSGSYGSNRYMYYLVSSTFYRYDTYTDTWQTLATPPVAPASLVSLKYSSQHGYYGRVISATSGSLQIAALTGQTLNGYRIRIISGTGAGQERNIIGVSEPTVVDNFFVTTANTSSIVDSTKTWKPNRFIGYQAKITVGGGAGQIRKILYNTNTTLTLQDYNLWSVEPWIYGGPLGTSTTTNGTYGVIESSIVYLDVAWTTTPDASSEFMVLSGGIFCVIPAPTSTAGFCLVYYDILADVWYIKMTPLNMWSTTAAATTADTLETFTESPIIYLSGSLSSLSSTGSIFTGSYNAMVDITQSLALNSYANYALNIISGSGMGQKRTIIANSGSYFYINRPWSGSLDTSSAYTVIGDYDKLMLTGNGAGSLFLYSEELDMWSLSQIYDYGVCRGVVAKKPGWEPLGLSALTANAGGISALSGSPSAGGSGYHLNDILTITTGGAGGTARVVNVDPTGSVTSASLESPGITYVTGSGKATTVVPSGGSGCTLIIGSTSTVISASTGVPHYFQLGDTASILLGTTTPSDYTGSSIGAPIIGIPTPTSFNYAVATSPGAFTVPAQSTTFLTDVYKSWYPNEHVGKLIMFTDPIPSSPMTAGTSCLAKITSNTSSSISFTTPGAYTPTAGKSKYAIVDMKFFGCDSVCPWSNGDGFATGGSSQTLIDTTKNWTPNIWVNRKVRIIAGTGVGQELFITSSTSNTLTLTGSQTFSPSPITGSLYSIEDCYGIASSTGPSNTTTLSDVTQIWPVNYFTNKKVRMAGGVGGVSANPNEGAITSNISASLTFTSITTGPQAGVTPYSIMAIPNRGASDKLIWTYNTVDTINPFTQGKYLFCFRGGGTSLIDRYNILTGRWDYMVSSPQSELFNVGSMYVYDGKNGIYITNNATGHVFKFQCISQIIDGYGMVPYGMNTAIIGNRMEIFKTIDGISFLYIMRHTGTEMWRTLLYI